MSKQTAMLIAPTLEEVKLAAAKMALPDHEAQKFFHYYQSNGWRVGKVRMVSFQNALAGWKLRWEERQPQNAEGAKRHWAERELDRLAREAGQ